MNEYVTAALNGQPVIEFRIELRRGAAPSTLRVVLPPGRQDPGAGLVLEIGDGLSRRTFRQFLVDRVEALGDGRRAVLASDARRHWDREVVSESGAARGDGTGAPRPAQELVDALFRGAGLSEETPVLPSGVPPLAALHARGLLGDAFVNVLAQAGLTCGVDDDGVVRIADAAAETAVDTARLAEVRESVGAATSAVHVAGAPAIELVEVTDWQGLLPDDNQVLRPIDDVLAEWGVDASRARQACLSDGGFDKLLPATGAHSASRLATLKRYAFRLFRGEGPGTWLPVGGVTDTGEFLPPRLIARIARGKGRAPVHPAEDSFADLAGEAIEEFEIDTERRTLYLPRPPFALMAPGGLGDATLQDRRVTGDPRITLTIARHSARRPFQLVLPGPGDGEPVFVAASHLVAVYGVQGDLLNGARLTAAAHELATRLMAPPIHRTLKVPGVVDSLALGACDRVEIEGGSDGLITRLYETPSTLPRFAAGLPLAAAGGHAAGPVPSGLYQPINAYRAGPLVMRASGETPEGEAVLAMEATRRDERTGALTLEHPGGFAFPFFLASREAAKFGRWFFVAGVEVADSGRLRVLAPDARHEEIPPRQLFETRHVAPRGLRGLIVSLGDEPLLVDTGPLVADTRGREPGATSSLVYDLDGSRLSRRKRGGLQFLSVIALSPAHRDEGARDGGWVPALNLREGDTGSPETPGRGLFAEGVGHDLGRLTAKGQGGPILADGAACSKHLYGVCGDDDGVYRETAGHISTDAFFKVPGDPVHDAPVKFYAEKFEGGVPPWRPYEAQLKYDATEQHNWNRTRREGRWKIQYRVPFLPGIPPTWDPPIGPPSDPPTDDPPGIHVPVPSWLPYDIRPAISEYELWAPSHDWVPAPSARGGGEVPFPGPSIKSEGWAGETNGRPDPALGGGCIFFPPHVSMPDAQTDGGKRETFLLLHPEVALAFGHPDFGNGGVHGAWVMQLAGGGGHLQLLARDTDGDSQTGLARGVHISGHLAVARDGATLADTQALRLGAADDEGIAFGDDVQLYREDEATLRTDANVEIGGKLTVEGLIDPTGLELDPQATNPGGAPGNTLWISSADARVRAGANVLAYASEVVADKRTLIYEYTGTGSAGKDVLLPGINRAHVVLIFRHDDTTEGCVLALPFGATGDIRARDLAQGTTDSALSLDAPSSGLAQTLTINSIAGNGNAGGVAYRLLVIGTP
ncbi:MAG: hypothetical protein K8I27_04770 [Planctomycetes bacterium]|nr:hypothetical protein [Planctomycetota bacterium]